MSSLICKKLAKSYGHKQVVKEVSLELYQGEIVGLLGPNGAGKTTSFYMLTGIIQASSGQVIFFDSDKDLEENIGSLPLYRRARYGISYLPQESSIFRKMTVLENLQIILEYTDLSKDEQKKKADQLLSDFGLTKLKKSKASYLSGGERRRLEIARSLIRDPKFVLLDEPFAGIDPIAVMDIQNLINALKARNIGVLISDHNVRETLSICDRAYLMYQGSVIFDGTPTEIINNEQAKLIYLGDTFKI